MQCDECGNSESVIHLTQIENNQMSTSHLCQACAAAKGLDTGATAETAPLADFLAQMGKVAGDVALPTGACPSCGLTSSEFKKRGRVGCAQCYAHFGSHLRRLLRKLHGATQHVGKVYLPPDSSEADHAPRAEHLRRSLARAVDAEDFEHAAALRDQIRRLEAGGG